MAEVCVCVWGDAGCPRRSRRRAGLLTAPPRLLACPPPPGSGVLAQEEELAMSLQFMNLGTSSPLPSAESKLDALKTNFIENPQYFCSTCECLSGGGEGGHRGLPRRGGESRGQAWLLESPAKVLLPDRSPTWLWGCPGPPAAAATGAWGGGGG